jgi:hypothetical protein
MINKSVSQIENGKQHKTFKHNEGKPVKRAVHIFHRPIEILAMIGQARPDECCEIFDMDQCKNDIFVCETPNVIHDLFYTLLKKTCCITRMSVLTIHELLNLILGTLRFKKTQVIEMLHLP